MTLEDDRRKKDEKARTMSDADLQSALEAETHSGEWHKAALREISRRRQVREREDDRRQKRIEYYTLIILMLTIVLVVLSLRECSH